MPLCSLHGTDCFFIAIIQRENDGPSNSPKVHDKTKHGLLHVFAVILGMAIGAGVLTASESYVLGATGFKIVTVER